MAISYPYPQVRRQLLLDLGTPTITSASAASTTAAATANPTLVAGRPPAAPIAATTPAISASPAPEPDASTIYITTRRPSASAATSAATRATGPAGSDADIAADGDAAGGGDQSSSRSDESTNILARAVANSNLTWWQLICVAIAGALVIGVGVWAIFRQRRKKREDTERRKEVADKAKEKAEGAGAGSSGEAAKPNTEENKGRAERSHQGEGSDWDSEEYDSVSDGGTIRPRRRWRRRRGRDRDRRYRRDRRRRGYDDDYSSDSDDSDYSYRGDRRRRDRHRRRCHPPSPDPTPAPSHTSDKRSKRQTFRDSVFSTYQSMKSAAVRLKQAEIKDKLEKQLEVEERIEAVRRDKVREANEEIERERAWVQLERQKQEEREREVASQQLLIPPVRRHPSTVGPPHTSSTNSSATPQLGYSLRTPRTQRQASVQPPTIARIRQPARGATVDTVRPSPNAGGAKTAELGSDIQTLLGQPPKENSNKLGSQGLRRDSPPVFQSVPGGMAGQSLAVKPVRERPGIPVGGLQAAPKGRLKTSGAASGRGPDSTSPAAGDVQHDNDHGWPASKAAVRDSAYTGVQRDTAVGRGVSVASGGNGNKWTDRMRARR